MNTTDEKLQQLQKLANDFKAEMDVLANKTMERMYVMFKNASDRQEVSMHMFRDMMDSYYQRDIQILDNMSKTFIIALEKQEYIMKESMDKTVAQMQDLFRVQEKTQENNRQKFLCMAEEVLCRQEKHMVEFMEMMNGLLNRNTEISSNETKN